MGLFKKQQTHSCYGVTHSGKVRANNEDYIFYSSNEGIYVVSDGMGGHNAGEIASSEAVQSIDNNVVKEKMLETSTDLESDIKAIMLKAHQHVIQMSKGDPEYRGMGCTVSFAYLPNDHALHTCHVGDSRLYIINEDGIEQIGTDHSVVAQAVKHGQMTPEEAETCNFKNKLTMAIGAAVEVEPEYVYRDIKEKDRILLCSDGLWSMIPDEEILQVCLQHNDAKEICEDLLARSLEAGGYDNISIVLQII